METSDEYFSLGKMACFMGAKVSVTGMVEDIRDQGGLLFIDLKNNGYSIQALVIPDNVVAYAMSQCIEKGYVVEIKGKIKECPASIQEDMQEKKIEIEVEKITIISARHENENKSRVFLGAVGKISRRRKKKLI